MVKVGVGLETEVSVHWEGKFNEGYTLILKDVNHAREWSQAQMHVIEQQFRLDSQRERIKELEAQIDGMMPAQVKEAWDKLQHDLDNQKAVNALLKDKQAALEAQLAKAQAPYDVCMQDVQTAVARALSDVARARTASAWRPIESAPRDGTRILLYVEWAPQHEAISIGWWNGDEWAVPEPEVPVTAKFWQPLPEAPKA